MVQKPESDTEPKERRIDLSLPQVAGSAVAAVAAAVAASQLGVYGTIAGAGVMSVVATCGGSVFQHFFRRTGEQIREVTVQVTHPEGRQVTVHTKETTPAAYRAAERRTDPEQASAPTDDATTVLPTVDPGAVPEVLAEGESAQLLTPVPETDRTQLLKPVAETDRTQMLDLGDARTRMLRAQPGPGAGAGSDPDRTQLLPQAGDRTQSLPQAATRDASPDDAFTEGTTHGTRLRGWKRPALAAAAVFAVSMAGITAFEVFSGNDLSGGKGTTLGSVVRGGGGDRDSGPADPVPSGETGQDGEGEQGRTPGDGDEDGTGTGSAPATDPGDGNSQSPDPGTGTGGEKPDTGSTPTPTPTPSGSGDGGTTPAPTPTPSAPDGGGATGAPDPTTAPGAGGAAGQGEQAPPADGTGGE
ncbi:hypothetical protein [Streptomyces cyaneofuscatus]|uniref:Uncharacterized protein n=1 Tax=Streptomyces cyaneofuscatus TaxID=66883 RepID=A0ABZ1F3C8_9ACTN|nr:hypothetical protein [Streptomyces cyaneofuscatus]WSB10882.1 hypothetical protein OG849_28360 [Streptomyces cyaneofuscatus]WSD45585.1 hypothetical protein OG857_07045 [Streptomyces cyaneofuscatus]WTA88940.1 hypothetical protein OG323_07940 [Streptomyces cyaneofuscatus]